MSSSSKHVYHLRDSKPYFKSENGSIQRVSADEMPILKNLSIKLLRLQAGAIREPNWYANCAELAYCLEGDLLLTILDNGSKFSHFTVSPGQMFHVPSGSLHCIENVGHQEAEVLLAFRHERPIDFSLQASFGAMSDAVLGNTYDVDSSAFAKIKRNTQPKFIVKSDDESNIPDTAYLPDPHKFDIEKQLPPVAADGVGSAKVARNQFWPILQDISMYSLQIEESGMREPHWHPDTAELGYVHRGQARMSILDPDGSVDTYLLKPGDCYFVPHAYPHQIECLDPKDIHFLIFFDQPFPGDVGFRTSATALSRNALAATFGVKLDQLPEFPRTVQDPLLVHRINPRDKA